MGAAGVPFPAMAGIARRLASMVYESLLAIAIAFFAALLFYGAASGRLSGINRSLFQVYLIVILGLYFVWCWHRGGQTLPMKTWKLRLVSADGGPVPSVCPGLTSSLATRRPGRDGGSRQALTGEPRVLSNYDITT